MGVLWRSSFAEGIYPLFNSLAEMQGYLFTIIDKFDYICGLKVKGCTILRRFKRTEVKPKSIFNLS